MKHAVYILMIAVGMLAGCGKTDETGSKAAPGKEPVTVTQKTPETLTQPAIPVKTDHVADVKAGKQFAKELCASCHGMNGIQPESGSPFIAGLKEAYIATSSQSYLNGSRNVSNMKAAADKLKVMKQLKPEQIADISAYYASLDAQWKGAGVGISRGKFALPIAKKDVEAVADIAARCDSCHGKYGNSVKYPEASSLAAMPPDYFIYSLKTYFNGQRQHEIMKVFKASLDEKTMRQLAAYYAVQTPKKPPASNLGNAKSGEAFVADCSGCHGPNGNSLNPAFPSLAGQPSKYLAIAMRAYRNGVRKDPAMKLALKDMSDGKIADIAAYYATLEPVSQRSWEILSSKEFRPVEDGKRIARMCEGCHGKDGNSTRAGIPSLSGLTPRYLTEVTIAYRDGLWKHDTMQGMVKYLQNSDIEKVGFYYALQEPVATKKPGKFDLVAGEKIRSACTICHSDEAIKKDPRIPNLNGQDHQYLIEATMAYGNGKRNNEDMKLIAQAIKPQNVSNLINVTGYFTAQKANKPRTVLPQPPMKTIEKCHGCHGEKGEFSTSNLPRLAGQSEGYLLWAMKGYQDMRRKGSKEMNEMFADMSLMEMNVIAEYYAKQDRKPVTPK